MRKSELDKKFQELLGILKKGNKKDFELIEKAWLFAKLAHTAQERKSGEPFINHPLEVAIKLAKWGMDNDSIIAGLLHDTIEHGGAVKKDLINNFGSEIAKLVDGVTQVAFVKLKGSRDEWYVENLRKMFLAMAKDLRVVLIKLAERLHNMETLSFLESERRIHTAEETLEIFAPLAERLGMGEVKRELEELAFSYMYPKEYKKVKQKAKLHYKMAERVLIKMRNTILKELADEKVKAKIQGRKKNLYSLWTKLNRPETNWDFRKVHDIVALRILVNDVSDCYKSLGIVHSIYKQVPSIGIRDYIAQPKPNGYKSIHTNVFGPGSKIVEVQIRTHNMHEQAEFGLAAHWQMANLKAKGKIGAKAIDEGKWTVSKNKLYWVKQLAQWQKEIKDSKEFIEAVKFDALKERIFVFSPRGDVYDLPVGATPVDFAFAVHTNLAEYIKSAMVNGKVAPLSYKLKSGDVVEIIKTKNYKKPSSDWLNFVVTTVAKRKIKRYLSIDSQKV